MTAEADEYYDGDELAPASNKRRLRNSKLFIGFSLITFAFGGFTFAANISLSSGNIEFGQAVYEISACDQYVRVTPQMSGAVYFGQSYIDILRIEGLDALNCRGTNIRIELFSNDATQNPLALFYAPYPTEIKRVLINISPDPNTTRITAVGIVIDANSRQAARVIPMNVLADGTGSANDSYHELTYAPSTGIYSIQFFDPAALVSDFYRLTLESSST